MFDICIKYDISEEEKKKFFLKKTNNINITRKINKCNNIIFRPESFEELKKAVNKKKPLGIIDAEQLFKKNSLHYIKSGIDDTISKEMGDKKIGIVLNLKKFLIQEGMDRSNTIARMKKNMKYALKYEIPVFFASLAEDKYELFNGIMIKSIARVLGLKKWDWAINSYEKSVMKK